MKRVGVFVSGQGGNLQHLLEQPLGSRIALVVTDRLSCPALHKARLSGVPIYRMQKKIDVTEVKKVLSDFRITDLLLLGFMRILPEIFFKEIPITPLNLHPSLLPSYKGLKALERSFADSAPLGASLHEVTPGLDEGPLLFQQHLKNPFQLRWEQAQFAVSLAEKRLVRRWQEALI